ncbi:Predicted arabinose efflux permease, MFS family [Agrococcus baldri]|uniref:Predicted arabinose efflux permease, MFS family n=1 Tax=Agrococcus baldri TaxID=153730 RepID=A0AA94HM41_9MICO|nr:MFS transporter [Agrococcus baldri]SFS09886.1 Predicted arabinose efflux permease, MFS family [Agrococcus baldri]
MPSPTAWRNAVFATFFAMGFGFASWMARVPHVRDRLDVSTGEMGLILLGISLGSVTGLLLASHIIHALGTRLVASCGMVVVSLGLAIAGWAVDAGVIWLVIGGFILGGSVTGMTDVAMNISGAANERAMGKPIMPIFHAFFSLGTVAGAGIGGLCELLGIGLGWQATGIAVATTGLGLVVYRRLPEDVQEEDHEPVTLRERLAVWKDPRTIMLGLLVLGMSLTEGSANDWLALTMVDGHGFSNEGGAFMLALFLTAMTGGRLLGVKLLERFGRVPVLRVTAATAAIGLLLVIFAEPTPLVIAGVVLWGVGASLGFPVGMSAASDEPRLAAARVGTVSAIGYIAFLAGPPLLGLLGDLVGMRMALLVVLVFVLLSLLTSHVARERGTATSPIRKVA